MDENISWTAFDAASRSPAPSGVAPTTVDLFVSSMREPVAGPRGRSFANRIHCAEYGSFGNVVGDFHFADISGQNEMHSAAASLLVSVKAGHDVSASQLQLRQRPQGALCRIDSLGRV